MLASNGDRHDKICKWKRGNNIRRRGRKILRRKNVIWKKLKKTRKRIKKKRRRRKKKCGRGRRKQKPKSLRKCLWLFLPTISIVPGSGMAAGSRRVSLTLGDERRQMQPNATKKGRLQQFSTPCV